MRQTSNDLREAARLVSRACACRRLHAGVRGRARACAGVRGRARAGKEHGAGLASTAPCLLRRGQSYPPYGCCGCLLPRGGRVATVD